MFKNSVLLAIRNISRQKVTSAIAILGLSLGLASAFLLYGYIDYHLSFDDFSVGEKKVYRVLSKRTDIYGDEGYYGWWGVNNHTVGLLKEHAPSIESVAVLNRQQHLAISVENVIYLETITFVGESFFHLLSLPEDSCEGVDLSLKKGEVLIDRNLADKFYPDGDAVGKYIEYNQGDGGNLKIVGVITVPRNSHLYREEGQFFSHLDDRGYQDEDSFTRPDSNWRSAVYFTLRDGAEEELIQSELDQISPMIPLGDEYVSEKLFFEEVKKIHLFSRENSRDIENPLYMVLFLSLLALLLLIISIVNCLSILTAQSIRRTREVGIRLVLGGTRRDLRIQFLTETVVLSLMAGLVAIMLTEFLRPYFSNLVAVDLKSNFSAMFLLSAFIITLITGLLAGVYPAFYLASLPVVESVKGNRLLKLGRSRKFLVFSQFFLSAIVLLWSITLNNEVKYIQSVDIGFQKDDILSVFPGMDLDLESEEKLEIIREQLLDIPGIKKVAYTSFSPFQGGVGYWSPYTAEDGVTIYQEIYTYIDKAYPDLLELDVLEGEIRENSIVVMESVREYRNIEVGDLVELDEIPLPVGAVIKDYLLGTPLVEQRPLFHIVSRSSMNFQLLKIEGNVDFGAIEGVWKRVFPLRTVNISTMEENIRKDNNPPFVEILKKVILLAMVLTLFISSLGLFGLTLHNVKQSTKAIGIRKVMGAQYSQIVWHFLKEAFLLIAIALISGIPVGVISIKSVLVLMGYGYPVHDQLLISMISALALFFSGVIFILFLVLHAAKSEPAEALRYE